MNESLFTPCANWASAKVMCCTSDGKLCYGFKCGIVILTWNGGDCSSYIIQKAHEQKINGIAAAPCHAETSLKNAVVTCGDGGFVRLWNTDTYSVIKSHNSHWKSFRSKQDTVQPVAAVAWSTVDTNLVVSAGVDGCLVAWFLNENVTNKFGIKLQGLTSLICSPTDADVVAIGSTRGHICIYKMSQNGTVIHNIRACENSIVDMAWQPSQDDSLIAVASSWGELSLFRSKSGRAYKKTQIAPRFNGPGKPAETAVCTVYPLVWYNENTLLTRRTKTLAAFTVSPSDNWRATENEWRHIHEKHRREFHALAVAPGTKEIWTIGRDRHIMSTDFDSGETLKDIGIMHGGGICIATSPHDPNRIVFGSSDGNVRVWDVTQPTASAQVHSKKVKDKVMSVAWHPSKDNKVVFGTSTGRLGIIDVGTGNTTSLNQPSNKHVYKLQWGTPFSEPLIHASKMVLYSLSNSRIFVHSNPDTSCTETPHDLSKDLNISKVTDFSWKPDRSLFAVGCEDGRITIFKPPSFSLCHVIPAHKTLIQNLSWHPQMTSSDSEMSPYHDLVTCGSKDVPGDVKVFKVSHSDTTVFASIFATLNGHQDYVQSASWSPHNGAHLVTTSADCTIQVWNVATRSPLVNFSPTPGIMSLFAIWSPMDADFIISGSMSYHVSCWRISKRMGGATAPPVTLPIKENKNKKKFGDKKVPKELVNGEKGEEHKIEVIKDTFLAQKASRTSLKSAHNKWITKIVTGKDCYNIMKASDGERPDLFNMAVLASDNAFEERISKLKKNFLSTPQNLPNFGDDVGSSIFLWHGDLKEILTKCIQEGGLTAYLVALAPSVSPRLWLEACQAYGRQLRVQLKFKEAANYFVAGQQIDEAIKALINGFQYLDAFCLGRLHYPPGDEIFTDIMWEYAKYVESMGQTLRAAESYIYLKKYDEAARVLALSKEPDCLRAGALAAKLAGLIEEQRKLALQTVKHSILSEDLDLLISVCDDNPEFQILNVLQQVYRVVQDDELHFSSIPIISETLVIENSQECYTDLLAVGDAAQEDNGRHSKTWRIVHQLSLSICACDSSAKLKHILSALHASQKIIGGSRNDRMYALCCKLRPNPTELGVFGENCGYGKSLRSFLCVALIDRLSSNKDDADVLLPIIKKLSDDLLDERSFRYHRAKYEVNGIERELSQKAGEKKLKIKSVALNGVEDTDKIEDGSNGKKDVTSEINVAENSINIEDKSEGIAEVDLKCNSIEGSSPISNLKVVNSEKNTAQDPSQINLEENINEAPDLKPVKVLNADSETNAVCPAAKEVSQLIEKRNQLMADMEATEKERGIIPNPMRSFCLLRSICDQLKNEREDAIELLNDIVDKWTLVAP